MTDTATAPATTSTKTPLGVTILGAVAVVAAMLTLCGGGVRFVSPEGAIGAEALQQVFEVAAARRLYYTSVFVWMLLAGMLAVSGGGMLAGAKWSRSVGLAYAWITLAAVVVITVLHLRVVPSLDEAGLNAMETMGVVFAAAMTGCCPTVLSLAMLAVLYDDRVASWARV